MKTLFTILLFIAGISIGFAQQIDLTGQVSIHNSRYRTGEIEYVADASVQAPFAGETSSDSEGLFRLTFQGIESGTVIKLTAEKAGLEVVNERDILNVVLGRKQPLKVFLAEKGELAQRQAEFYEVSLAAVTARHDVLITALLGNQEESEATIQQLKQQLNREVTGQYEAEALIHQQLRAAKERLPEMSKQLAEVNLDFASDTYREAYGALLSGNIESALKLINEENLAAKAERITTAITSIEKDREAFQIALETSLEEASQVYNSYALKADAYELIFNFQSAVEVAKKGVRFLATVKNEEDFELLAAYRNLALKLRNIGEYSEALVAMQKSVDMCNSILSVYDPNLATCYSDLALVYQDLNKHEDALKIQQQALFLQAENLGVRHPHVAVSWNNIALNYLGMKDYQNALDAQQKALVIQQQALEANHPHIATSYSSLAIIYQNLENYEEALLAQEAALRIREQTLPPNHPDVASSYNSLSLIYRDLGNYEAALSAQRKALKIRRQVLPPNHPRLGSSNHNIVWIFYKLNQLDSAIIYENRAHAIWKEKLPATDRRLKFAQKRLVQLYSTKAKRHADTGAYNLAVAAYQLAVEFSDQPADLYRELSLTSILAQEVDNAINYLSQAIKSGYDNWEWIRDDEALDPLRKLPRFRALLAQAPDTNN